MKKRTQLACVAGLVLITVSATGAVLDEIQGASSMQEMTDGILAECPAAEPLVFSGVGDGEQRLLDGEQELSPMTRFLHPDAACRAATPRRAQGLVVALDAVHVASAAESTQCPSRGVVFSGCFSVADQNGVPGLQCTDCDVSTQYCLEDEFDALRILLAGVHHESGEEPLAQDCDSDVRHTLANNWDAIFEGTCAGGPCSGLAHIWRPADDSTLTETLLALLNLPDTNGGPFCNGPDVSDHDPIRRPCEEDDTVCDLSGTSGLVLPVVVPAIELGQAELAYPTDVCEPGRFGLAPAQMSLLPTGGARFDCPERASFSIAGLCLAPQAADGSFACISPALNPNVFFPALNDDARAFNRYVRIPSGQLLHDPGRGVPVIDAWYRLRTDACADTNTDSQLGCLAGTYSCSLGISNRVGTESNSGAEALAIAGIAPTDSNVRLRMLDPAPHGAYPLARPLFINSMAGFQFVQNPEEDALTECLFESGLVENAAVEAGLYSLGRPPRCRDFDETLCNGAISRCDTATHCGAIGPCVGGDPSTPGWEGICDDSCSLDSDCSAGRLCTQGRCEFPNNSNTCNAISITPLNLCPELEFIFAAPLQVSLGGLISVQASGFDSDGDQVALTWSAAAGYFDDPLAASTFYHCETQGTHAITISYDDGRCAKSEVLQVTCL